MLWRRVVRPACYVRQRFCPAVKCTPVIKLAYEINNTQVLQNYT